MGEERKENLARLLREAQAGSTSSLQLLCKELEQIVRGYFQQKFTEKIVVDDLCQETYARFLSNLTQVRDDMKLTGFVSKVAFHVMQDYLRQKYRRREEELQIDHEDIGGREGSLKRMTLDNKYDDRLLNKLNLENALRQLPQKSHDIITLKCQGYNYEEIAQKTGLTVSGVKMQVKRSLEQLKYALLGALFAITQLIVL